MSRPFLQRTRLALQYIICFLSFVATASAQWHGQSYKTESFVAPDLDILYYGGDLSPGYLVFGPIGTAPYDWAPVLMTDYGDLVWQGPTSRSGANNVKVQKLHGNDVLTFWTGFGAAAGGVSHGYGSVAILDQTYTTVYNVCMSALDIRTTEETIFAGVIDKPCYMDIHESWVTDKGTIVFTAVNVTRADLRGVGGLEDGWILDWLFYEADIKTEEVLFRYSSADHISRAPFTLSQVRSDLTKGAGASSAKPWDFSHINAVQPLPATINDGDGYFFSARHYCSLFAVGANGTILWRLSGIDGGDFTLDSDVFFSWQHDARIHSTSSDGSQLVITLFNNDNYPGTNLVNQTTALFLNVDLSSMHVSLAKRLADDCNPLKTVAEGSFQALSNGHGVIGYGFVPYVKEYDRDGKLIYEANWGPSANGIASSPTEGSYRAFKQEWRGIPAAAPKIFAEAGIDPGSAQQDDVTTLETWPGLGVWVGEQTSSNGTASDGVTVWLSWNGATEYEAWTVYAGNDSSTLLPVSRASRQGFETSVILRGAYRYVQGYAVSITQGAVLAKTEVLKIPGT